MPNLFDLVVVAASAAAFTGGWKLGLVTRASSWIGMGLGLLVGARSLPRVAGQLEGWTPGSILLIFVLVLSVGGSLGLALGLFAGSHLSRALGRHRTLRGWDRVLGGLASVAAVLSVAWLLVPAMADMPQWPAHQARGSTIARVLDALLPPPPGDLEALGREVVGEDAFPRVLEALEPAPRLLEPPSETGLSPEILASLATSTVRITSDACGRVQVGSGFVVREDLVLTNAHVIAGATRTDVTRDDGVGLASEPVLFDPERDVALLRVPGLGRPAVGFAAAAVGDRGGVFGFPAGGGLRVAPFEIARNVSARGSDIYDREEVVRDVYFVAADLQGGDSGAALVRSDGEVVGVAFAVAPDRSNVAYALTVDEVLTALEAPLSAGVDTGACLF